MKRTLILLAVISLGATPQSCKREDCVEKQKPDCVCTMQYDPVCGCNKKTYSNACAANCAGITSFEKGECPE
jgi:hypothetical protein